MRIKIRPKNCHCPERYRARNRCLGHWKSLGDWTGNKPCPSACTVCGEEGAVSHVLADWTFAQRCEKHA